MARIPYKNPRAVCALCGKEWAARNVEPRYHRCSGLPKPKPKPPAPRSFVACDFFVNVSLDDLQGHLDGPQIQAVMNGLAQVIAAQRCVPLSQTVAKQSERP